VVDQRDLSIGIRDDFPELVITLFANATISFSDFGILLRPPLARWS
jgi:hypothetical protein